MLRKLPRPHKGQRIMWQRRKRFNTYVAGRRHFKSTFLSLLAVRAAVKGKKVLACAPTYDQARILFDNVRRMLGNSAVFNISRMECVLPTGGVILFRSLDSPKNVRGHTADLVLIDEAGYCKEEAWYEVLRPMLFTTGGGAWLAGTPNGRNWFYTEYLKEGEDRVAFQAPTVGCKIVDGILTRVPHELENPTITFAEIAEYYNTVSAQVFAQEVLANFTENLSTVFRNVRNCATAAPQAQALPLHSYIISVDLAKVNDFTVYSVLDALTAELVHMDRFHQVDYTTQEDRLVTLCNKFTPRAVVVEVNSAGEPFCERLEGRGLPVVRFTTTNASKKAIIEALALALEREELKILNDETLIGELLAFEAQRLPTGRYRYSAPGNLHDDCVMSLAIGWGHVKSAHAVASWYGVNPLADYRG